ncbi:MAG: hypothetical protein ABW047_15980, partial [Nitrospiraceae bacterium]
DGPHLFTSHLRNDTIPARIMFFDLPYRPRYVLSAIPLKANGARPVPDPVAASLPRRHPLPGISVVTG